MNTFTKNQWDKVGQIRLIKNRKLRIGIMGGTFDPIHYGHLVTAVAAYHEFNLDKVFFVPSGRPPHKKDSHVTDPEQRYMMCEMATITNPNFEVSRLEIEREGYSYTKDTVKAFHQRYAGNCEIYFISGADAVLDILQWKDVDALLAHCTFIAATRPGFSLDEAHKFLAEYMEKIKFLNIPALAISSTDIRRRVSTGDPITYLLPENVEGFIYKQRLYHTGEHFHDQPK